MDSREVRSAQKVLTDDVDINRLTGSLTGYSQMQNRLTDIFNSRSVARPTDWELGFGILAIRQSA